MAIPIGFSLLLLLLQRLFRSSTPAVPTYLPTSKTLLLIPFGTARDLSLKPNLDPWALHSIYIGIYLRN